MTFNFCPQCGTKLVTQTVDFKQRQVCPHCHYIHWNDNVISVGGVVVKDGRYLLTQRANNPGRGHWTNPGGFVEQTETLDKAIVREIQEETGIITRPRGVFLIGERPLSSLHTIYVNFLLDYVSGQINIQSNELMNAGFFSLAEMASMDVAGLTREIIHRAQTTTNLLPFQEVNLNYISQYRLYD